MKKFVLPVLAVCLSAQIASAQLVITEAQPSSSETADWFELTNTGNAAVDLENYYWDDDGPTGADGALFPAFLIQPGQSIVILGGNSDDQDDFETIWGTGITILNEELFSGDDTFSGLSSGGDQIEIWDADPNTALSFNLVASVSFGPTVSDAGISFEWDTSGNSLGMSVAGEFGATNPFSTETASPGFAAVPEPASFALVAFCLVNLATRRRK